jgi:hypothetical protein
MINLKILLEDLRSGEDGYFYHVTLAPYAPLIQKNGLKSRGIKSTVSNYKEHSRGKIFLCDAGVLDWWIHTIAAHAFHGFDDEAYHDIAVFRILKTALSNIEVDKIGSDDSRGGSYYVTQNIPPNVIEFVKTVEAPY